MSSGLLLAGIRNVRSMCSVKNVETLPSNTAIDQKVAGKGVTREFAWNIVKSKLGMAIFTTGIAQAVPTTLVNQLTKDKNMACIS